MYSYQHGALVTYNALGGTTRKKLDIIPEHHGDGSPRDDDRDNARVQRIVNKTGGTHSLEDTRVATDDALPTIHTRTSPTIFVKAVSGLSEDQRCVVRDMGFGCLLDLKITATPTKMEYWLVDNFSHMDRKLQLYDGEKIHMKEDDVYSVMGLPRGTIEVTNRKKKTDSGAFKEWADIYNVSVATKITATKVLEMIQTCDRSDDWFKRHFVVLMITCLFESSQNGVANLRTVHLLDDLSNVNKMNWCAYLIRCLVGAKKSWNASRKRKNFTGPLLFFTLFYVDKVVLSIRTVARSLPIFKSWNNGLLKVREQDEIAAGAFERGYVDDDIHVLDARHHVDIHDGSPIGNDVDCASEVNVQLVDDAFWNDPKTLAILDAIIDAVAHRDRFKRIRHEGPSFSLGLGLTPDDEDADVGRFNSVNEFTTDGPSYVDVPSADRDAVVNEPVADTVLDCVQGVGGDANADDPVVDAGRPKRSPKFSSIVKSPFQQSDVIIYQSLSLDYAVKRDVVACLEPNTPIPEAFIDLWALIMNDNEKLGSRGSVACFFATTRLCNERQSLAQYMGHPSRLKSSKAVALSIPEFVDLSCTEGVDVVDASVVTMRHMETFKGRATPQWNPDVKRADKRQIDLMRKRYCYVIAFAPFYMLKDKNLAKSKRFQLKKGDVV
ncbi:Unknown protein [Striga hermonthica]|uniref:Uncharacterized protein n=1 Tax=Striga hermonthica TaxID=68872 RepID=A0A9N7RH94_STRHE|nr:Unknown protein [Striga hermonthica]